MNFEEAKKELIVTGKEIDPTGKYVTLRYQETTYANGEESMPEHEVYMDGFGWHNAAFWIEALAGLAKEIREKMLGKENINEDNQ